MSLVVQYVCLFVCMDKYVCTAVNALSRLMSCSAAQHILLFELNPENTNEKNDMMKFKNH